ncbi:hypothetical protein FOH10_26180 [Nocardia otitidiscaviarum]|uniref:Uncharacterized protein n=1 Tax=Nocardia otitidiscaviarum TaxID=1823 RepID=A0A516NS13_9NOCA|nr:hypothetical protein [Nocardia otitidiscaviarum]MCP9620916.1 hypothetical protein [Nocardia otitidiscaviarum]QDP81693.1 hypothetical protein FOH10_26180 [Nocardia otitidiscaviarum]
MPVLEVNSVLAESAFGGTPERAAAGLPVPANATESWLRAVALSGVGHYAAARAELARTRRLTRDPILRSHTLSTEASFLRQLGWHALAATLDGRAANLVLPDADPADRGPGRPAGDDRTLPDAARHEAVCDALTGLAADALGTGRPKLAARLLRRSRRHLDALPADYEPAWRPRIRLHWVSAETALYAPGAGLIAPPEPIAATRSDAAARPPVTPSRMDVGHGGSGGESTAAEPTHLGPGRSTPRAGSSVPHAAARGEHLDPAHTDPSSAHADPALAHADPALAHADPALAHPDPALAHADPALAHPDPALAHAAAALALAERSPSVRHRVKSGLLVAAATAAGGDVDRARELAENVAGQSRIFGLLPLRWACAMLLSGLDSAGGGADEAAVCAALLAARGGRLRTAA